ncbi:hypothetical protein M9Y10_009783 [Tritrichomonas musculus]|uniref:Myb-like DNA-binding domain containing protein n=1 Tax=Tritrichomonas musculus TaxID=1915356 RepID=A0ABR2IPG4_9EUKA
MTISNSQPTFRTRTNESLRKCNHSRFTEFEDHMIVTMVDEYKKAGDRIRWGCIASKLSNKTGSDVSHRWNNVLNPDLVKGSWTPKEDLIIIDWVKEHGPVKWNLLQQTCMPHRSGKQVRERWVNIISPSIEANSISAVENVLKKKSGIQITDEQNNEQNEEGNDNANENQRISDSKIKNANVKREESVFQLKRPISCMPWTKEEDDLLMNLYDEFGPKWKKMSFLINGRSENSIKNRFQSIKRKCTRISEGKLPIFKRGRKSKLTKLIDRSLLMMQNNEAKFRSVSLNNDFNDHENEKNISLELFEDLEMNFKEDVSSTKNIFSPSPESLSVCSQPVFHDYISEMFLMPGKSINTLYDDL